MRRASTLATIVMAALLSVACDKTRLKEPSYAAIAPAQSSCVGDCRATPGDENDRSACFARCEGAYRVPNKSCIDLETPADTTCATHWREKRRPNAFGWAGIIAGGAAIVTVIIMCAAAGGCGG